jgi:hypothetical protein
MQFTPMSDEQIVRMGLMDKGVYPFEVISAENAVSKSSNEMIKLQLRIWDRESGERILYDYLLAAFLKKLKHFSDIANLKEKYNSGSIVAEDCVGKSGYVLIDIQEDKTDTYPPKNVIKDYVKKPEGVSHELSKSLANEQEMFDDQLPF